MPKSIPNGWEVYSNCGTRIKGTRFIAFKVPLSVNKLIDEKLRFTPAHVIEEVDSQREKLAQVIDLTYTTKYYKKEEFENEGVSYLKIYTEGHLIPSKDIQKSFFSAVDQFLLENSDNDNLLGVHCTHGVNRTGYLICRYMIDKLNITPAVAIKAFGKGRGHEIERSNMLADLRGEKVFAEDKKRRDVVDEDLGSKKRIRGEHWNRSDSFGNRARQDYGNKDKYNDQYQGGRGLGNRGGFMNQGRFGSGGFSDFNQFGGMNNYASSIQSIMENMGLPDLPMGSEGVPELSQVPPQALHQLENALQEFSQSMGGVNQGSIGNQGKVPRLFGGNSGNMNRRFKGPGYGNMAGGQIGDRLGNMAGNSVGSGSGNRTRGSLLGEPGNKTRGSLLGEYGNMAGGALGGPNDMEGGALGGGTGNMEGGRVGASNMKSGPGGVPSIMDATYQSDDWSVPPRRLAEGQNTMNEYYPGMDENYMGDGSYDNYQNMGGNNVGDSLDYPNTSGNSSGNFPRMGAGSQNFSKNSFNQNRAFSQSSGFDNMGEYNTNFQGNNQSFQSVGGNSGQNFQDGGYSAAQSTGYGDGADFSSDATETYSTAGYNTTSTYQTNMASGSNPMGGRSTGLRNMMNQKASFASWLQQQQQQEEEPQWRYKDDR